MYYTFMQSDSEFDLLIWTYYL